MYVLRQNKNVIHPFPPQSPCTFIQSSRPRCGGAACTVRQRTFHQSLFPRVPVQVSIPFHGWTDFKQISKSTNFPRSNRARYTFLVDATMHRRQFLRPRYVICLAKITVDRAVANLCSQYYLKTFLIVISKFAIEPRTHNFLMIHPLHSSFHWYCKNVLHTRINIPFPNVIIIIASWLNYYYYYAKIIFKPGHVEGKGKWTK